MVGALTFSCQAAQPATPTAAPNATATIDRQATTAQPPSVPSPTATIGRQASAAKAPDAANATYTIDRQSITLLNGTGEQAAAPGSATKIVTKLSDKQVTGDVSGDGQADVAVVLIHSPGGSGAFFFVAAVLNDGTEKGKATNAELLGDRISVDKLSIVDGQIVVDYLDRRSGEPMVTPPSVKATKRFAVKDGKLVAVQ